MLTDNQERTGAVRDALKAYLDGPVITVELTPEQQAAVREQSGGRIDTKVLALRPDMDLHGFLSEATTLDMTGLKTAYWNPPKASVWVLPT